VIVLDFSLLGNRLTLAYCSHSDRVSSRVKANKMTLARNAKSGSEYEPYRSRQSFPHQFATRPIARVGMPPTCITLPENYASHFNRVWTHCQGVYRAKRTSTGGTTEHNRVNLRGTSRPSSSVPNNWPLSTMTLPRKIVVVGHPSTDQPSHGL
jgi:hypothetical protein